MMGFDEDQQSTAWQAESELPRNLRSKETSISKVKMVTWSCGTHTRTSRRVCKHSVSLVPVRPMFSQSNLTDSLHAQIFHFLTHTFPAHPGINKSYHTICSERDPDLEEKDLRIQTFAICWCDLRPRNCSQQSMGLSGSQSWDKWFLPCKEYFKKVMEESRRQLFFKCSLPSLAWKVERLRGTQAKMLPCCRCVDLLKGRIWPSPRGTQWNQLFVVAFKALESLLPVAAHGLKVMKFYISNSSASAERRTRRGPNGSWREWRRASWASLEQKGQRCTVEWQEGCSLFSLPQAWFRSFTGWIIKPWVL